MIYSETLRIGLVNIMPVEAMHATTQRFLKLLNASQNGINVSVKLYTDQQTSPKDEKDSPYIYDTLDSLFADTMDGIIVTGTNPQAVQISEEPRWPAITSLVEWAGENCQSAIWSCFSAHAAAFHLDGVLRERLPHKYSGVYDCVKRVDHPILSSLDNHWKIPHSRYNTISKNALAEAGYSILSVTTDHEPDIFTKRFGRSEFLFFHGHPEYGPEVLLAEYRRDLKRFLTEKALSYPSLPEQYFAPNTIAALETLKSNSERESQVDLLATFDRIAKPSNAYSWTATADSIYADWLRHLAREKFTAAVLAA